MPEVDYRVDRAERGAYVFMTGRRDAEMAGAVEEIGSNVTGVRGGRLEPWRLPLMPDGGSIILNSSIVGSKGFSSNSMCSVTKAAVRSLARTWTTDLKDRRV